jgi:hypothetical protein
VLCKSNIDVEITYPTTVVQPREKLSNTTTKTKSVQCVRRDKSKTNKIREGGGGGWGEQRWKNKKGEKVKRTKKINKLIGGHPNPNAPNIADPIPT